MSARLDVFAAGALPSEVKRFIERTRSLPDVARVSIMPDVHLAGDACVGTVVGTRSTLRPYLLGSDLGCGVAALRLGVRAEVLDDRARVELLLSQLAARIPLLARPRVGATRPAILDEPLSHPSLSRARDREGLREHATVGRGNHFVELQEDEAGDLFVMVHSGSRALGPMIQAHHLGGARPRDVVLHAESEAGRAYLHDVDWAARYAASSRRAMALEVASIVAELWDVDAVDGAVILDCHHDAIARETHDGQALWVHRKGAVPASLGAPVLVPGSMGTCSFHCVGRGEPRSMSSSAHGAGRALPRGEATRRIGLGQLAEEIDGVIVGGHLDRLRDEAPSAYKDIEAVMRAQGELVRRVRRLRPRVVHK